MKANTARKYRLYPDRGQAERLTQWSHTCRAVWNTALAQRIWAYRSARRVTLRAVDQCAELTEARAEHDHGGELVAVPAPGSSQTCNACGVRDPESRQGCGRLFACVHCGHTDHGDRNAALTILDRAFSTAGWAGPAGSGIGRPQSTRSPQGRGTRTGSRLREPTSRTAA